ncbi:MAG: GAF domain-containing sensor histidine kinase [Chloroflexota bacterium]
MQLCNFYPTLKLMIRPFDFKNWNEDWNDVQWHWVLIAGIVISLATVIAISSIIAVYSGFVFAQNPQAVVENSARIERLSRPVAEFGSTIAQLVFTYFVTAWVVRRVGTAVYLHGFLCGVMAGVGILIQVAFFSQNLFSLLNPIPIFTAFPMPILAGHLGARRGYVHIANQEQLYRTSQAILRANHSQGIVSSIGENLVRPHITHVGLWEILLQDAQQLPTAVSRLANWSGFHESADEIATHLTQQHLPQLVQLRPNDPLIVRTTAENLEETAVWDLMGVRSLLVLPLVVPSGNLAGLLTIGSRANSGFSQDTTQDYVTIGTQVGLVLENIRLLKQAQETGKLQERQRMAREIHDTLAQGFTSIVMHLEAAEQGLPSDVNIVQHHLDQARETARTSLGQARRVVDDLRPEVLESAPLHEAIERVVSNWERQSGITAVFETNGQNENLHPEVEVTLLRGAQEALANIRKHAQASEVQVTLSYLKNVIILDVADNGVGFSVGIHADVQRDVRKENGSGDENYFDGGYGLIAMNERVAELGGEVTIESEPNEGTTVAISIPLVNQYDG